MFDPAYCAWPAGDLDRGSSLVQCVQRLDDSLKRGGIDLCGTHVAVATREGVRALTTEHDALLFLAILVLHRDGQLRLVERGRLVDEPGRAGSRERRQQRIDLRRIGVFRGGGDLLPLFARLLERDRLSVADRLDTRRVERPRIEDVLDTEVVGG